MKSKLVLPVLVIILVAMVGFLVFSGKGSNNTQTASNISIVDGKQIITINAKGGYSPRITNAKANVPTVIKFETQNTFDCSSSVTIPVLGYQKNLPPSGEELVDVPAQKEGSNLRGLCSMGMYSFNINFN